MKIYRGDRHKFTDSKELRQSWKPGEEILLDGTIDGSGERHTHLWLQIEEHDVIDLFIALLDADPKRLFGLLASQAEARQQEAEILHMKLRELRKLGRRIDDEALREDVGSILRRLDERDRWHSPNLTEG